MKLLKCLLLSISIGGAYSTYAQSTEPQLIANDQQQFINTLINSKKSTPPSIKIGTNESFSFKLNVKKQTNQSLTLIGTVNGQKLSSFSFSKTNDNLKGTIILYKAKKAYTLYSETDDRVFIKETDIDKVLCVDFEKVNTEKKQKEVIHSKSSKTSLRLESLPGAPGIIYLDFDGELVQNSNWAGGATINAQSPNFSDEKITEIWKIMAEDFRPFNLNITTRRDLFDAAPKNRRMMCIFTPTNDAAPDAGGVAFLNSFSSNIDDDPCWIYNLSTRAAGETGSHEVGHTLGLSHDGQNSTEYYEGHGQWSPIMGWSADRPIGQWSAGEYTDATSKQDDIAIISNNRNGVGIQNDDHGNNINSATPITVTPSGVVNASQNFGLISTRNDKDLFSFAVETGNVSLNFDPDPDYPNLNIKARILNELGQEIFVSDPSGLNASINQNLSEGIYYIEIDGVGEGTVNNGYSDYASLGNYTISGNYTPGDDKNPPLSDFEAIRNCFVIDFKNKSTNKINSYQWDFGDGNTSTEENPSHTYSKKGNYTVFLKTINDSGENTKTKTDFIIIDFPEQPIVSNQNVCSGESVTIAPKGNSDYKWYTTISGGTSIASGKTYQTPALTNNQTYYIEGVLNGCSTSTRTKIEINVMPNPDQPIATDQTICKGESITLSASGNSEYKWYETSTGGTSIFSGATFKTPVLDATKTYYIEGVVGNCTTKTRTEVKAIVLQSPEQPKVSNQNSCVGESVTIVASGSSNYRWYNTSSGGTSFFSGKSYKTPALDATKTYYVEGRIGDCVTTPRTEVKIIVSEQPEQPIINIDQNKNLNTTPKFANYQWYYNEEIVTNANQAEFSPTKVGEYSVEIFNEAGCSKTSKTFSVDQSLLNFGKEKKIFKYYPNPVNSDELLHIDGITIEEYSITIVNTQGQIVIESTPSSLIDTSILSKGLYILLIDNKPIGKLVKD
ncbi:PKD domain-containing protein [Aquimarina longa]|uniref:Ig-like domain-containing protein n=1 Tax=Aquimarina longa TaxID=1080221 RepID=UPI00130DC443|nr:PKD domain-containing protein [Aquimarina longa]